VVRLVVQVVVVEVMLHHHQSQVVVVELLVKETQEGLDMYMVRVHMLLEVVEVVRVVEVAVELPKEA
jgi:hypothetical protein